MDELAPAQLPLLQNEPPQQRDAFATYTTTLTAPPNPAAEGTIGGAPITEPEHPIRNLVAAAITDILADPAFDFRAYLEKMARTDPRTFFKYVAPFLPAPAGTGGRPAPQQMVVQVISALPRSPLDSLPQNFKVT